MIGMLARIGQSLGFQTWVGQKEQSEVIKGVAGTSTSLSEFCKPRRLNLKDLSKDQWADIVNIDLIWYINESIDTIFEVENTTAMTEALRRASSIPYNARKYMVLPDERSNQLDRKRKSPMFKEWFESSNWQVLFYGALESNERDIREKKKNLNDLVGIMSETRRKSVDSSQQLELI